MKGMLIKDFMLLKRQRSTVVLLIIFALIMLMSGTMMPIGIMAYITVFAAILAMNSTQYDEFDNGYAFLFTLPVTVKSYVLEKYLFTLLLAAAGCLFSGSLILIVGEDTAGQLASCAGVGAGALILVSIMMPLQLKFGIERSRIIALIMGCMVVCASLAANILQWYQLIVALRAVRNVVGEAGVGILIFAVTALCYAVSFLISVQIVKRKEF